MKKLIKLLNEYMPNMIREERHNGKEIFTNIHNSDLFICYTERVISKRFGFIKWLVDNDKIDFKKVIKNNYWNMSCISNGIYDYDTISNELKTKYLLMILSIQDNPIEFLVSIL